MLSEQKVRKTIALLILGIVTVIFLGTVTFHRIEGWSYLDSMYFSAMTVTTVGYGDFTPTHNLSKIITILFSLTFIPFVFYGFSFIASHQIEGIYRKMSGAEQARKKEVKEQKKELEMIEEVLTKPPRKKV